jgi:hypothetical protein
MKALFIIIASLLFIQEPDLLGQELSLLDEQKLLNRFNKKDRFDELRESLPDSVFRTRTQHTLDYSIKEVIGGKSKQYKYTILTLWIDTYTRLPMNENFIGNSVKWRIEEGYSGKLKIEFEKGVSVGEKNKIREKWEAFGYGSASTAVLSLLLLLIL